MTYEELVIWMKGLIQSENKDVPVQCEIDIHQVLQKQYESEDLLYASM